MVDAREQSLPNFDQRLHVFLMSSVVCIDSLIVMAVVFAATNTTKVAARERLHYASPVAEPGLRYCPSVDCFLGRARIGRSRHYFNFSRNTEQNVTKSRRLLTQKTTVRLFVREVTALAVVTKASRLPGKTGFI